MANKRSLTKEDVSPTMADLIRRIVEDTDLNEVRRRNVASSIRRLCALLGVPADQAPANFWFFRERLDRFHPAEANIKVRRWQTIRSDVAFALKHIGRSPNQPKPRARLSLEWGALHERAREAGIRWKLTRLAGFCDARNIPPSAVDDAVMADYETYVRDQTFKTKPHRHHRDVCVLWNKVVGIAADCPLSDKMGVLT